MNYFIKISRVGRDVKTGMPSKRTKKAKKRVVDHMLLGLAMPYLIGAKLQINRYKEASLILKKNSVLGVYLCLHEASCLFEDLATVSKYVEMCGKRHKLNEKWLDIRNHIRHDVREQFDDESDGRKIEKAKRLGIPHYLQTSISFDKEAIKVGSTIIKLATVKRYLEWAERIINENLRRAEKDGLIRHSTY